MKQRYGFTLFENPSEFAAWLKKQKKYGYTGIQEHHMYEPSYKCWKEDALTRQKNIKDFHVNTNHWGDIAQHFSTFPDGSIVTGRSLSKTVAIGIKGWNTKKICIENYGDFDKRHDNMTDAQKKSVIALTALLCEHEGIKPSTSTIKYHCWFTAGGVYLGDFDKYKSCKTCPGTGFFGGNTKSSMKKNFLPLVKKYLTDKSITITPAPIPSTKDSDEVIPNGLADKKALVIGCEKLNVRKNRPDKEGTLAAVIDTVVSGTRVTIGYVADGWASIFYTKEEHSMNGFVNVKYLDLIEDTKKETTVPITDGDYDTQATVVCETSLNIREARPGASGLAKSIDSLPNGTKVTLGYVYQNWGSVFYVKDGKNKSGFVNVKYLKIG